MYWGRGVASQAVSHGLTAPKTNFPGLATNFRYLLKLRGQFDAPGTGRVPIRGRLRLAGPEGCPWQGGVYARKRTGPPFSAEMPLDPGECAPQLRLKIGAARVVGGAVTA
jgi:hypothetical protein